VESGLYLVSTPIGNMGDMTARAMDTLRAVDVVYAEDTRRTGLLLHTLGIDAELRSLHEHNEARRCKEVVARLAAGGSCALVSDAGTPIVSDPGQRLVEAVIAGGHRVVPIPGPSAILAALTVAGVDATSFTFVGFAPRRGRDRTEWLSRVAESPLSVVAFESPRRLAATLEALLELGVGERQAAVCRELTKKFEEVRRGTVAQLSEYYRDTEPRGEVTLVLAGRTGGEPGYVATAGPRARELAESGRSARDIARVLAEELGVPRNEAYRIALDSTEEDGDVSIGR
jgi:16S rRNA (cytidine1402-2'-O)-methyltransferase